MEHSSPLISQVADDGCAYSRHRLREFRLLLLLAGCLPLAYTSYLQSHLAARAQRNSLEQQIFQPRFAWLRQAGMDLPADFSPGHNQPPAIPLPANQSRKQSPPQRTDVARNDAQGSWHQVKAGDTLSAIARRHGVSAQVIAIANGLADADLINVGRLLRIPTSPTPTAATAAPVADPQLLPATRTESLASLELPASARSLLPVSGKEVIMELPEPVIIRGAADLSVSRPPAVIVPSENRGRQQVTRAKSSPPPPASAGSTAPKPAAELQTRLEPAHGFLLPWDRPARTKLETVEGKRKQPAPKSFEHLEPIAIVEPDTTPKKVLLQSKVAPPQTAPPKKEQVPVTIADPREEFAFLTPWTSPPPLDSTSFAVSPSGSELPDSVAEVQVPAPAEWSAPRISAVPAPPPTPLPAPSFLPAYSAPPVASYYPGFYPPIWSYPPTMPYVSAPWSGTADAMGQRSSSGPRFIRYVVQPTDTLASISRAHGITADLVQNWNGVQSVQPGQVLLVPIVSGLEWGN